MRVLRSALLAVLALLSAWAARPLVAQSRPGLELAAGAVLPLSGFRDGLLADTQLRAGPSFAVFLNVPQRERRTLLLGFTRQHLRCSGECGEAGTLASTSWNLGMRWFFRPGRSGPWVRAALLLDRSEADFLEEGVLVRRASYLGLGGEAGVGATFDLHERIRLLPGVRFAALDSRFPGHGSLRMRYAVADLALVLSF